jgi:hypothetical protein
MQRSEHVMVFWGIVGLAAVVGTVWFVRTPLFRAHLHGHGRDPGDRGTRVEGKYGPLGGTFNKPEKRG